MDDKPLVYKATETPETKPASKNWPKLLIFLVVVIVVIEVFIGIKKISASLPPIEKIQPITEGKIVLSSSKSTYRVGEPVKVSVKVVTGGRSTDGTDLILKYDPSLLEASTSSIVKGTIYKDYVLADIDTKQGVVRISGVTPPNTEGFVGIGEFATVNFIPKKEGQVRLAVDYLKDSTTDSNILETITAKDILTEVINLDLSISNPSTNVSKEVNQSCAGYYQLCRNLVNQTGKQFCAGGAIKEGSCSFDPKFTNSCDTCKLGR